jgi:ribonuclease PH
MYELKRLSLNPAKISSPRAIVRLRELSAKVGELGFAEGSVLFGFGQTKVLCSVSLIEGVPGFLKGKKTGWLNAEYAMLPCASKKRQPRIVCLEKRDNRSVEIARIIGRSLRSACDLSAIGERTIQVDCDVIQADGGTRVCAISGSCLALIVAQRKWLELGLIKSNVLMERIAAVSVIVKNNQLILDACQEEDLDAHADFNFVMTESGNIVEIQGTSEKTSLEWDKFFQMKDLADFGISEVIKFFQNF